MKEFEEEMVQPDKVYIFPHSVAAFSKDGLQILPLQKLNFYCVLFKMIEEAGFDPTECTYEVGNQQIMPFKTEEGEWNYEIKNK